MTKITDPRALAMAAQLRAEIAASEYGNAASFVRALNDTGTPTDYTTFYNRTRGKAELPMSVLFPSLDLLGITFDQFVNRAMKRIAT
ncbi:hypothetical protein [Microbacterium rhizomatis]|uniref:XRE family transcriptional regulator n=1 Tax=Microbacterium rhizomatis TaxID=1631477 RepID=A0A5J5J4X1_9MICO|nr:hypothetical protein [Microbacterium rhizomatis]KAA9110154.1 hypothetical protein F6B43_00120 [Microbacterium rhizomatis]